MPPNRLKVTIDSIRKDYPNCYSIMDSGDADFNIRDELEKSACFEIRSNSIPYVPENQLCTIAFTSGTTGQSQPNYKYWRTLRIGCLSNARMLLGRIDGPVNLLSTVPPQHMWGLETTILLPLFANVSISNRSPFYPQDVSEALGALPAPRVLVTTPVHLRALLNSRLDFGKLELILTATAPLSSQLGTDIEKALGTTVLEVFGCSESGILASRLVSREDIWSLANVFKLYIEEDHVKISADHLPEDVFLQDVIEKVSNSQFRWLGRRQDLVNIAGKRCSLADINRRLLEISGVYDGVVFFPSEEESRLAALVVAPGMKAKDIYDGLRHQIESIFIPRPILMVEQLPRTESGKLPRQSVIELFIQLRQSRNSN